MNGKATSKVRRSNRAVSVRPVTLAAGAAISMGAAVNQSQAQYVWNAPASGTFNNGANWQGGTPPTSGPGTSLTFTSGNVAAITASNDTGPTFPLNSITFSNCSPFTVAGLPTTSAFQFAGASPMVNLSALAGSTISSPVQLAGDLTIGGSGIGNLTLSGAISDDGGARRLTIAPLPAGLLGSPASQLFRTVVIGSGVSSYTGGLTLDGGNMRTAGFGATTFGTAGSTFTVTSNGGVIQAASNQSNGVGAGTWAIGGTLRIIGAGTLPLATGTTQTLLTGAGTLAHNGTSANALTISSNSTAYTGSIVVDKSDLPQFSGTVGGAVVSGANGAIVNASSIDVRAGGSFTLANTGTAVNNNRLGDTMPINLRSGTFALTNTTTGVTETVGTITGTGYSTITTSTTSTAGAYRRVAGPRRPRHLPAPRHLAGQHRRHPRQHLRDLRPNPRPGRRRWRSRTTNISILPYAIGDTAATGAGASLVTYDAGGIRPLNTTTEYAPNLSTGINTNARLTAATANAGNTVNALAIATGGSVTGAGTLNVTSGVILNSSTTGSIASGNTVAFGSADGHVFGTGTTSTASVLTIDGQLSGTNGLTKSGGGLLRLTNDNTGLTGQLTINAGYIDCNSLNALPGEGRIVASGTGGGITANAAGLSYSGAPAVTLSRDIDVKAGFLNVNSSGGAITLSGEISGAGGLFIQPPVGGGDVYLTGNNTYTGVTFINNNGTSAGVVHIDSDANLGNGGTVDLTATLRLEGDWNTSRMINLNSGSTTIPMTIDTNGHNAMLSGPFILLHDDLHQPDGGLARQGRRRLADHHRRHQHLRPDDQCERRLAHRQRHDPGPPHQRDHCQHRRNARRRGLIYRNINIASGGTLAPGNSAGNLTLFGNASLAAGSIFAAQLNGPMFGTGYNALTVNGSVSITGSLLNASLGYNPIGLDMLFIVLNDGTDAITGTFDGLPDMATLTLTNGLNSYEAVISYFGDSATGSLTGGNDIVIQIPSPGAATVLALGGVFAFRRRAEPASSSTVSRQSLTRLELKE